MTTASVMTYDSLVENIQSYLERTDTATLEKIPLFIMLAEQTIASQIKFLGNLTVVESTMVSNQPVIDKPARWHKTVSFNITVAGERQPVLLRKYEYLREYWPNATDTGIPAYFADYDYTHWLVAPTPATSYTFEVLYTSAFNLWILLTRRIGSQFTRPKRCCMGLCCRLCRSLRMMSAWLCGNKTMTSSCVP